MRIIPTLAVLLAFSGAAAAQNAPCPECDEDDGGSHNNSYSSIDLGVVDDEAELLADTDVANGHGNEESGFWAWLSICLSAWLQAIGDAVGLQTDADASVEVFVSEDGVDLDMDVRGAQHACAAVDPALECDFDFDESDLGDLDGMTWEAMADVNAEREALGLGTPTLPGDGLDTPSADLDACLHADLALVACG